MDFTKHSALFGSFAQTIASQRIDESILSRLTIASEGAVKIAYAPFDYIVPNARLVIVSITPGKTQAINALRAASNALGAGKSHADVLRIAKLDGSFSGAMRNNLVAMLNEIGIASVLGVRTCEMLFEPGAERVHLTSALRYPVFVDGENYNGSPDMLKTPILKSLLDTCLLEEAARLPDAIWLPLGPQPMRALEYLCAQGALQRKNVLQGLPHPSGANAERIAYFLGRKERSGLSSKTNPVSLDAARERLKAQVHGLAAPAM